MSYLETYENWKAAKELTKSEKARLLEIASDDKKIREMFSCGLAFGTAGMRGVLDIGPNRMNVYTVKRATKGLADFVSSLGDGAKQAGVVISYDTRRKSTEFAAAAAKVLSHEGIKVYLFEDVRPVPFCSFAVRHYGASAGIMITASHNPKEYNGYKVYGPDGAQMSEAATEKVVEFIAKCPEFGIAEADTSVNEKIMRGKDNEALDSFITVIGRSLDEAYFAEIGKLSLSPEAVKAVGRDIKIVYTPIHGSGYMPVTKILSRMGISVQTVAAQADPDPDFSTVAVPNPEDPGALKLAVELANNIGADVVIGTDPDCDRMGVAVRNSGGDFVLLNGNQIGSLLADYILSRHAQNGTLPVDAAVVKTIVTTDLAAKITEFYGATVFDVLTGFKYIGELIKEWEQSGEYTFMFGFEESYGYLSGTHARDKDAVVSAMLFAEMTCKLKTEGVSVYEKLAELYKTHGYFSELGASVVYPGLDGMKKMADIMKHLRSTSIDKIADEPVVAVSDFLSGTKTYESGAIEVLIQPEADVLKFHLENGDWICVRPSGTEPKLKLYAAASADKAAVAPKKAKTYLQAVSDLCSEK